VGIWLLVGTAALLLAAAWIASTRAYVRRRRASGADWSEATERPQLWTSSARCPDCGSRGGLLTVGAHGGADFECLSCGARHAREHRG
jgi:hypothetical protein